MADVIINDIYLSAIADAIRTKLGTESTYTPPNMASAIRSISGGGSGGSYQTKTVDPSTSQQIINPDTGYDALSSVTVNAMPSGTAGTPIATKGTVSNHSISITPSVTNTTGYIVGGKKTGTSVSVSASELVSGSQTVTSNGTVDVTNLAEVVVNVNDAPTLQTVTKSYTPTESSQSETIVPGTGYDGLSEVEVTVDAISSTYVGSGIDRRSSSNLTASSATVTAPAGYYASSASKSVATGTAGTPIATKSTVSNHSISITPSVTNTTGYITGSTKNGTAVTVSASELVSGNKSITSNGTNIDVTNYATVSVAVGSDVNNQDKSVTPTESEQSITADSGYTGLGTVTVGAISSTYVGSGIDRRTVSNVTSGGFEYYTNGTYHYIRHKVNVESGYYESSISNAGYSNIIANITNMPKQAATTITPSETQQTAAEANQWLTGAITVSAIPSDYVGSGITSRSSTDLTASGATVTVPAGYYASQATKSVSSMTLPTAASSTSSGTSKATITPSTSAQYLNIPTGYNGTASYYIISAMPTMTLPTSAASSATSGYTSKATIGRSTSDQYINIPTGYNSAGGYYKISAVANGSATGPTSLSGSSATVSTGTNTITLTKTGVSTTPTVSAGYVSSATSSSATVALTASVTTKAAATITPGTTNQTIASGTYLTGTQTIAGDANLVGSNILSTASIFGVQGTVVIQSYYTGSTAPSSSLGNDGDLYLQV